MKGGKGMQGPTGSARPAGPTAEMHEALGARLLQGTHCL